MPHPSPQVNLERSGYQISVRKAQPAPGIVEELMCVVVDRNPALGNFFLGTMHFAEQRSD